MAAQAALLRGQRPEQAQTALRQAVLAAEEDLPAPRGRGQYPPLPVIGPVARPQGGLANAVPAEQRAANYDSLMAEAREMVRKGQLYWDYVSAENSVGFHNPAKALDTLMSSVEFSNKAVALAEQATGYSISPALAGDIKQIVPPILNMSRKLQQDADFLQQHPWTRLLPVLPKAEQVWDGQERIAR